ncbi:hypothetical protein OUO20_05435 [Arthrobacter sp. FX8]|uniref:hypothetical protein n=1 Tax=Arthrobacter sp. FX8 TaxID=2997335 RepID=UPI00227C821A|nr:hypothetical protein [Arthrobacter sp. FX8]WAJ34378.1 hypothetical protein OUO20_05435 [Arthrobacter sp. FX8]
MAGIDFAKLGPPSASDRELHPRAIFAAMPSKSGRLEYLREVQREVFDRWFEKRTKSDLVVKMNTGNVHRAVPATSPTATPEGSASAPPPASKQPPASAPAGAARGSAPEEAPVVTAEPDIFDLQGEKYEASLGDGWETSPAFLVVSDDVSKAADALGRAAVRFFHIDEYGSELAPERRIALEQAATTWDVPHTPNFVSDVYLTPRGPMIWTDTKGELTRPMGDAMLHVLLDELRVEGITAHVVAPPADINLEGVPVIPLAG